MIKSELIQKIADANPHMYQRDVETVVNVIFGEITEALARGNRVELRGFGAFTVKHRAARLGRNPRTGEAVEVAEKFVPFFKTGKELRERLNKNFEPVQAAPKAAGKKAAKPAGKTAGKPAASARTKASVNSKDATSSEKTPAKSAGTKSDAKTYAATKTATSTSASGKRATSASKAKTKSAATASDAKPASASQGKAAKPRAVKPAPTEKPKSTAASRARGKSTGES